MHDWKDDLQRVFASIPKEEAPQGESSLPVEGEALSEEEAKKLLEALEDAQERLTRAEQQAHGEGVSNSIRAGREGATASESREVHEATQEFEEGVKERVRRAKKAIRDIERPVKKKKRRNEEEPAQGGSLKVRSEETARESGQSTIPKERVRNPQIDGRLIIIGREILNERGVNITVEDFIQAIEEETGEHISREYYYSLFNAARAQVPFAIGKKREKIDEKKEEPLKKQEQESQPQKKPQEHHDKQESLDIDFIARLVVLECGQSGSYAQYCDRLRRRIGGKIDSMSQKELSDLFRRASIVRHPEEEKIKQNVEENRRRLFELVSLFVREFPEVTSGTELIRIMKERGYDPDIANTDDFLSFFDQAHSDAQKKSERISQSVVHPESTGPLLDREQKPSHAIQEEKDGDVIDVEGYAITPSQEVASHLYVEDDVFSKKKGRVARVFESLSERTKESVARIWDRAGIEYRQRIVRIPAFIERLHDKKAQRKKVLIEDSEAEIKKIQQELDTISELEKGPLTKKQRKQAQKDRDKREKRLTELEQIRNEGIRALDVVQEQKKKYQHTCQEMAHKTYAVIEGIASPFRERSIDLEDQYKRVWQKAMHFYNDIKEIQSIITTLEKQQKTTAIKAEKLILKEKIRALRTTLEQALSQYARCQQELSKIQSVLTQVKKKIKKWDDKIESIKTKSKPSPNRTPKASTWEPIGEYTPEIEQPEQEKKEPNVSVKKYQTLWNERFGDSLMFDISALDTIRRELASTIMPELKKVSLNETAPIKYIELLLRAYIKKVIEQERLKGGWSSKSDKKLSERTDEMITYIRARVIT